ncbi:hypothetical protein BU15DRAFT_88565 [Melanogaster broomeanus]|nr:hypothetical protein BU15DRAFT_88565 [Melanogaster broomeanus]
MAPSRTKQGPESIPTAGPSKTRSAQKEQTSSVCKQARQQTHEDALPGVQKLKSALRQTKRLLAKEHLGADVRVESERRMKALAADLAKAEEARKERVFALKYHKVKFFERQKVVRKISQTKRRLETSEARKRRSSKMIREQMERGVLSTVPENELGKPGQDQHEIKVLVRKEWKQFLRESHRKQPDSVAGDDFFGNDEDEEDPQQSNSEGSDSDSG